MPLKSAREAARCPEPKFDDTLYCTEMGRGEGNSDTLLTEVNDNWFISAVVGE